MKKIIVNHEGRKVIYDEEKNVYIKTFKPKFSKKLKFFLGLRRYPGQNYNYISNLFRSNNINVANVIEYDKYRIITEKIEGEKLITALIKSSKEEGEYLINEYVDFVSKIIKLGVYFGDFNFYNFIVHNNRIYAIDLEDYRKDFFSKYRLKSLEKRLKRQLLERTEILGNMKKFYDGEKIYKRILEKINF